MTMRPFERRLHHGFPYYKLAVWSQRNLSFVDGDVAHASYREARVAARAPGRYRICEVTERGRRDLEPFDVS